jgi:ribosomal protein S18 acetylase RimI-like enzyme
MTAHIIRPLDRGDLERVAYLVDSNDMFPSDMLEGMTSPYFEGDTENHRWLVTGGGEAGGVAYYVPEALTDGTWNLLLIAVDPAMHGGGAGSALVRFVENQLRDEGRRILLVETSGMPRFERTRSFYTKLGFQAEARIRDYYASGDDKVIFRKSLA